jgi:DNA-directed RNA polymerase subunit beta'
MAYHEARKIRENMDDAERRAIADAEAAELAGETEEATTADGDADGEAPSDTGTVAE